MMLSARQLKYIDSLGQDSWSRRIENVWLANSRCGIPFEREKPIRLEYKGIVLEAGYRLDFLVAECVVLELKAIEALAAVHDAQLITYLRLGGWRLGLLINFNVPVLKNGIHRRILGYEIDQALLPEENRS